MTFPIAPPASYPGTLKVFTVKKDGDVMYGAHANEWQEEIDALESTVGLNPQTDWQGHSYLTLDDRLDFLEGDTVRLEGNQTIHGTKDFADTIQTDGYLIGNNASVLFKYPDRQFSFADTGLQQKTGDGTTYRDMVFQPTGGQCFRASFRMWDAGNDGAGSGLDADLLDGHQAADFLLKSGIQVQMSADQTVPFNPPATAVDAYWRTLGLNTVTYEQYTGDGAKLWDSPTNCFNITPGLWVVNWAIAWEAPNNGSRGLRGVPNTIPVNASPATWNDKIYFGGQYYSTAPNWWPTTGLTAGNYLDLDQRTDMFVATTSFKMRVDVWNYCTANGIVHHDGSTHLHQPTSVSLAQIA